jgi:iron complex transport system ATP-binding protein
MIGCVINIPHFHLSEPIACSFREGDLCAIIGRSGAGKSSFLRTIAGLDPGATITINGKDIPRKKRKEIISFFPGDTRTEGITVNDVLLTARAASGTLFKSYTPFDRQVVDEAVTLFALRDHLSSSIEDLSGGIARRTFLARTLVSEHPLVLLDCPDEALDCEGKLILQRAFRKYLLDGSRVIVFATHDISFASQCADRIIWMSNGTIAADGGPDSVTDTRILNIFGVETIVSKNVYNGRPEIHYVPES